MGLRLVGGQAIAADVSAYGHGCQTDLAGVYHQVDPAFRDRFPHAYQAWEERCRARAVQPGDLLDLDDQGRIVFTLAIKRGLLDPVDLDALGLAFATALERAAQAGITAIGFHRLGTRCTGRASWPQVLEVIEPLAAASQVLAMIRIDAWDEFVDAHPVGARVRGRVQLTAPFGVFVDLGAPFPGLAEIVHWPRPGDPLPPVGAELDFEVIDVLDGNRQARLRPVAGAQGPPG